MLKSVIETILLPFHWVLSHILNNMIIRHAISYDVFIIVALPWRKTHPFCYPDFETAHHGTHGSGCAVGA